MDKPTFNDTDQLVREAQQPWVPAHLDKQTRDRRLVARFLANYAENTMGATVFALDDRLREVLDLYNADVKIAELGNRSLFQAAVPWATQQRLDYSSRQRAQQPYDGDADLDDDNVQQAHSQDKSFMARVRRGWAWVQNKGLVAYGGIAVAIIAFLTIATLASGSIGRVIANVLFVLIAISVLVGGYYLVKFLWGRLNKGRARSNARKARRQGASVEDAAIRRANARLNAPQLPMDDLDRIRSHYDGAGGTTTDAVRSTDLGDDQPAGKALLESIERRRQAGS